MLRALQLHQAWTLNVLQQNFFLMHFLTPMQMKGTWKAKQPGTVGLNPGMEEQEQPLQRATGGQGQQHLRDWAQNRELEPQRRKSSLMLALFPN